MYACVNAIQKKHESNGYLNGKSFWKAVSFVVVCVEIRLTVLVGAHPHSIEQKPTSFRNSWSLIRRSKTARIAICRNFPISRLNLIILNYTNPLRFYAFQQHLHKFNQIQSWFNWKIVFNRRELGRSRTKNARLITKPCFPTNITKWDWCKKE